MNVYEFKKKLTDGIAACPLVLGVAQTGDPNAPLAPGKSDVDLFVLCSRVPDANERKAIYESLVSSYEELHMEVCGGGIWGYGDIFLCEGIDVMPMYFTVAEMTEYILDVLAGRHIEKVGRFYPVGRLASIETIHILYEEDRTWSRLVEAVRQYPDTFFRTWYASEAWQILDEEDLGRSELRKEILFFHQVLENYLDHFLQVLYAVNKAYFPSRKRTKEAIEKFVRKPDSCVERLEDIICKSTSQDTIEVAVHEMRLLAQELLTIGDEVFGKHDPDTKN